jgi:shikimate kinase
MHVYLIGYRGSGKTTVGKLLAKRLDRPCVDCDDLIEAAAGMTIRELFAREGEAGFRDREQAVILQLASEADCRPQVVSLGGGAILREANRDAICGSGRCVWLTASPETLVSRMRADHTTAARRPALSGLSDYAEVVALLEARRPLYVAVAEKTVDTDSRSAEAISDDIADWINNLDRTGSSCSPDKSF